MNSVSELKCKLKIESNSFWSEFSPTKKSALALEKLLELHAQTQEWDIVVNLSSRAVLHINKNIDRSAFYYIWITALYELEEREALIELADHLLRMQEYNSSFLFLSLLSFTYSGEIDQSTKIYTYIKNHKEFSIYKIDRECLDIYLSYSKNKNEYLPSISRLKKNCYTKNASYFSHRNLLRIFSNRNYINEMSLIYNRIHDVFPFAQEPYYVSILQSIDEKDWDESIRLSEQLLKDDSKNTLAILTLVESYIAKENYDSAKHLLEKNNELLLSESHDVEFFTRYIDQKINSTKKANFAPNADSFQSVIQLAKEAFLEFHKAS